MADLAAGQWLGEWVLEEPLGRGGFAVVWRARHATSGRRAALKVPLGAEGLARLEVEARRPPLEHPGVVQVLEADLAHEPPFLALELVEGGTLRAALRDGRYSPERAARLIGELAAALEHAHARGLVHLDLKPENVLLERDGRARLTDFGGGAGGVDERLQPSLALSTAGAGVATRDYAAPEVREGAPHDRRADVYGLAVLAFEVLTGRLPLGLDRPSQLVAELPPAVDAVLARGLARDPARRTASCSELARALSEALASRGAAAEQAALAAAAAPPRRRGWRLPAVAAGLLAGGLLAWLAPPAARSGSARAERPSASASGGRGAEPAAAWTPARELEPAGGAASNEPRGAVPRDARQRVRAAVAQAGARLRRGETEEAVRLLNDVRQREPDAEHDPDALYVLAVAHAERGTPNLALQQFAAGVRRYPRDPRFRAGLAAVCLDEARRLAAAGKASWWGDDDEGRFREALALLGRLEGLELAAEQEAEVRALRQRLEDEL